MNSASWRTTRGERGSDSTNREVAEVADALFTAIERGDVETVAAMWDDEVLVWKSGDPVDRDKRRALRTIDWFVNATTERRYQVLDRQFFAGGFVQQHILHAAGRHGGSIAMRVCIVIKVGPTGLIHRIDEYFDPAEIAPLTGG